MYAISSDFQPHAGSSRLLHQILRPMRTVEAHPASSSAAAIDVQGGDPEPSAKAPGSAGSEGTVEGEGRGTGLRASLERR